MGSAAPRPTGHDQARSLLAELEQEARLSVSETGEIDYKALMEIVDVRLNGPHREEIRLFLVAYLARCLLGTIPRHQVWDPLL
jgi:hypothetical protein